MGGSSLLDKYHLICNDLYCQAPRHMISPGIVYLAEFKAIVAAFDSQ